jgi:hypothetical protein
MLKRVRRLLFPLILAAAVSARADWLVFIPSGQKLDFQSGRAEVRWAATTSKDTETIMGFGLTHEIEVDFTTETIDPRGTLASFDTSYTFTDPVVNFLPGFTVGIQDALNVTATGRRIYIATSYDVGLTGLYNSDSPMQLTIGAYQGGLNGPFVGVSIPFSHTFIGIAEHDSRQLTAGFEFKPTPDSSIQWLFRDNEVLWSAGFTMRF